ncbi:MAG: hypothetical protein ACYTG0_38140 [Planctomycetota bacterium]|jgi:hypothetical protein
MALILLILITTAITAIMLAVALLLASSVTDIELPPMKEFAWKVPVIVLASNVATVLVGTVLPPLFAWAAGLAVFWTMLATFFKIDVFAGVVIIVLLWGIRAWLASAIENLL